MTSNEAGDRAFEAGNDVAFYVPLLRQAVHEAGGPTLISERSGVPKRTLARYLAGDSEPGVAALTGIAVATGKSADWLLGINVGTPEMPNLTSKIAMIPRYDVRASAGAGAIVPTEDVADFLPFRKDWLNKMGMNPEVAGLIYAEGDSMEETISDGALMLLDLSIREVKNGQIYAIRRGDELLVKRIQVRFDGSVLLIPDNPRYDREEISAAQAIDLHVVGRVRWAARSF